MMILTKKLGDKNAKFNFISTKGILQNIEIYYLNKYLDISETNSA